MTQPNKMNAADQYLPWIKKRTRCGSKGKISVTPSVAYKGQSLGLLGQKRETVQPVVPYGIAFLTSQSAVSQPQRP